MQVVVFGANGKVGSKIVQKLLNDGHFVRAFVHSESHLTKNPKLQIIQGDIHDAKKVADALDGGNAVISALGSWGTSSKDIVSSGMISIIPGMKTHGITRIVSLTGSGARDSLDHPGLLERINRWIIRIVARKVFDDGEKHIALLRKSKLDWTVVRSPAMRESTRNNGFQLSKKSPSPWASIVRDEVANAVVDLVANKEWRQAAPYIRQR